LVPGIFPEDNGGRCVGLTNLPPSCAYCVEIWKPQTPATFGAVTGLDRDRFTCNQMLGKLKIFFNVRILGYKKIYNFFITFLVSLKKIKVIIKLVIYSTGLRFIRYVLCKVTFTRIMEYSAGNKGNKHGE